MSETPHEALQNHIEEAARRQAEYIVSNQPELEDFFRNTWVVENITNLIAMNWNNPSKMGHLIKQQLETDILDECIDRERERCE